MKFVTFYLVIVYFFFYGSADFIFKCNYSKVLGFCGTKKIIEHQKEHFKNTKNKYDNMGSNYMCEAKQLNLFEPLQIISGIDGQHLSSSTEQNVKCLRINSLVCHYMPIGLPKFFPNLRTLSIEKSGLRSIQKYDFYKFNELSVLILSNNTLMSLGVGLFDFIPKLEHVDFSNNLIFHVDPMVFVYKDSLKTVDLGNILCTPLLKEFVLILPADKLYLTDILLEKCSRTSYIKYLKEIQDFEFNKLYSSKEINMIKNEFKSGVIKLDFS